MGDQPPRHGSRQSNRSQSRSRISDTASEISEQDLNDGEYDQSQLIYFTALQKENFCGNLKSLLFR